MITIKNSLKNKTILITRPVHQAQSLATKIQARNGHVIMVPAIAITPPNAEELIQLEQIIKTIDQFDMGIFTSSNAVHHVAILIKRYWFVLPDKVHFFAIGPGTQKALTQANFINIRIPEQPFNSENLLALPELNNIKNKRIVIFSGYGGRELLLKVLQERGAKVTKAITYRRALPSADKHLLKETLQQQKIDCVITTSSEGLQNLFAMTENSLQAILLSKLIIVISKRMYELAKKIGFETVVLAAGASDDAILAALDEIPSPLTGEG